jgi:hypothetical protein
MTLDEYQWTAVEEMPALALALALSHLKAHFSEVW